MPSAVAAKTFGEMARLADLPIENKEQIKDAVIYGLEHETEIANDVTVFKLEANKRSYSFRRHNPPKIDKNSKMYVNGLIEGVTPDPLSYSISEYRVTARPYGWHIPFTDELENHSYDDVVKDFVRDLKNVYVSFYDEKTFDAYLRSANEVTSDAADILTLGGLAKLSAYLKKYAYPIEGFYNLVIPVEASPSFLTKFADAITHTSEKESVIKGSLGTIGGMRIVTSNSPSLSPDSTGKFKWFAYGKSKIYGGYPVGRVAYDEGMEVIQKPLGSLGNDPLNQRGSTGLKVDGVGWVVLDDNAIITGEYTVSGLSAFDYKEELDNEAYVKTEYAPSNLYPNATSLGLAVGGLWTLVVTDESGTEITSECTFTSEDVAIAKLDATTNNMVVGVKAGTTRILITKDHFVSIVTVTVA